VNFPQQNVLLDFKIIKTDFTSCDPIVMSVSFLIFVCLCNIVHHTRLIHNFTRSFQDSYIRQRRNTKKNTSTLNIVFCLLKKKHHDFFCVSVFKSMNERMRENARSSNETCINIHKTFFSEYFEYFCYFTNLSFLFSESKHYQSNLWSRIRNIIGSTARILRHF